MAKRVFIGVGHGGADPGAVRFVREADANLNIALELKKQLEAAGIEVGISRTKDENDPISEEIREANAFAPDLAVEVHNNAGGGNGWECYVQTNKYASESKACAKAIEAEVKAIGQQSRGIKTKGFAWTGSVKAPAVLLEGFFVDNSADAADFDTLEEQKALGRAYARGVLKYLGVDEKPAETVTEPYTVSAVAEFKNKAAAEEAKAKIELLGFTASISSEATTKTLKVGADVRMNEGARYYDGVKPWSGIYKRIHQVKQIDGDRVVITYDGSVIGAVHKDNLTLV